MKKVISTVENTMAEKHPINKEAAGEIEKFTSKMKSENDAKNIGPGVDLHVSGIGEAVGSDELKTLFREMVRDEICRIKWLTKRDGQPYAFAYVNNQQVAQRAIEVLDEYPFHGDCLSVSLAQSKKNSKRSRVPKNQPDRFNQD